MTLPKGGTNTIRCSSPSGRARTMPTSNSKPTPAPRSSPFPLLFFLLVMTALFADNFSAVVAFHQSPSPSHQNNNPNIRRQQQQHHQQQQQQQQQQDPIGPRTVEHEPHTTDFPKTSTPADDGDRKSKMFSPKSNSSSNKNSNSNNNNHGSSRQQDRPKAVKSIWETSAPVLLEASSLRTFDFEQPSVERVQVLLKKADMFDPVSGKRRAAGEPLIARVDLWHGPDSTPQNLAIYLEEEEEEDCLSSKSSNFGSSSGSGSKPNDGTDRHANGNRHAKGDGMDDDMDDDDVHAEDMHTCTRTPFSTIIETPQGHNTIAIRNIADSSDLLACVEGEESELLANEDGWYTPSAPPPSSTSSSSNGNSCNNNSNTKNDSPLQSVIQRLQATTTPQRIDSTTASHGHGHGHSHHHDQEFHDQDDDGVNDAESGDEGNKAVVGSCAVELPSNIASVQVLLQTQFMQPLQARIELELRMMEDGSSSSSSTSGTDYRVVKRTIVEVYSEDGMHRPFFAVLEAPRKAKKQLRRGQGGSSNANAERGWFGNSNNNSSNNNGASYCTSMRVVNLSTTEFPLFATVEPHTIDPSLEDDDGDNGGGNEDDRNEQAAAATAATATTSDDNDENDNDNDNDDDEKDQQQWTAHFGGGSSYDMISNSTILDAEIL